VVNFPIADVNEDQEYLGQVFAMVSGSSSSNPGLLLSSFEAAVRHGGGQDAAKEPFEREEAVTAACREEAVTAACSIAWMIAQGQTSLQQLVSSCLGQQQSGQQQSGQQRSEQQLLNKLFALQVSCLKYNWCAVSDAHRPDALPLAHSMTGAVIRSCSLVVTAMQEQQQQHACSSSLNSSAGSVAGSQQQTLATLRAEPAAAAGTQAAAQWVVLLSRCLFVVASALEAALCQPQPQQQQQQQQQQQPPLDGSEQLTAAKIRERLLSLRTSLIIWWTWCLDELLGFVSAMGLPADVMSQLNEQQAAVLALLSNLQDDAAAAADCSTVQQVLADMQEAGLPQQLRSFAQAVAGRIPLSTACNNPGCVSLAQRSELLLVGGKGCVCGRCKAAR
jgi:hypothetical protein